MPLAHSRPPNDVARCRRTTVTTKSFDGSAQPPRRGTRAAGVAALLASAVLLAAVPVFAQTADTRDGAHVPAVTLRGGIEALHAARTHDVKAMLSPWILSVGLEGNGFGNVTSSPGMINCGSQGASCTDAFVDGTLVTLNAIAEPESTFEGWSGDADCAGAFSISADTICIATFTTGPSEHVFANGFEGS